MQILLTPFSARSFRVQLLLIAFLLSGNFNALIAQARSLEDSLTELIQLDNVKDTTKVMAMCKLGIDLKNRDPKRAIKCINEANALSKQIKFLHGEALSLINAGSVYYDMGKHKEALEYWFESIAVYKKMSKSKSISMKALGLHGLTDNLISISRLYCEIGELHNFEKHVAEARKIMKENPSEYSRLGWIGIEWAGCYYMNGKNKEARQLYNDALEQFGKSKDQYGIANTFANLGMLHNRMDQLDSSLTYLKKSLVLYTTIKSLDGQSWVNNIIGNVYKKRNNSDSAFIYFNAAYNNGVQANNIGIQISSLINIGKLLSDQNKLDQSFRYWKNAYDLAANYSSPDFVLTTSKFLAEYYQVKRDYKSALEFTNVYLAVKDSLNTNENMKTIGKLEAQYDFDKEQATQASRFEEKLLAQRTLAIAEKKQQKLIIIAVSVGLLIVAVFSFFLYKRMRFTRKQQILIARQKEMVMLKNKEILDSINYAKRIQAAVLPATTIFKKHLPDSFILYKPKDIVAGDFYWLEKKNDHLLVAACDCTGHGVPGAMVSVICNNGLNRSVREHNIVDPSEILNKTREIVIQEFEKSDENVNDGMDVALVSIEGLNDKVRMCFAGANNPVWIVKSDNKTLEEIIGVKQPIGKFEGFKSYVRHERYLNHGDVIYLFTDGYKDQFGGKQIANGSIAGKKFKSSRLKALLVSIAKLPMEEQKLKLEKEFEEWRGDMEQVDDVCIIGIRV